VFVREFYKQCNRYPDYMKQEELPADMVGTILSVWRSRDFLCTVWPSNVSSVVARLSINRAQIDEVTGSWLPGITWDELYTIKAQVGFHDHDAIEIFPAADKLVNDSNMRHLWVMKDRIGFGLHNNRG
jgi:hypothetical protein